MASQQTEDITVPQGATFRLNFWWQAPRLDSDGNQVLDSNGMPVYDPVSFAGYRAIMQMRDKPDGDRLYFSVTSDPGDGILLEPLDSLGHLITGLGSVRVGADVTADIPKSGFYGIVLVAVDDPTEVVWLAEGQAKLKKAVVLL